VAGVDAHALADRNNLSAGEEFHVALRARCRAEAGCRLLDAKFVSASGMVATKREGDFEKGVTFSVQVPNGAKPANTAPENRKDANFGDPNLPVATPLSQVLVQFQLAGREFRVHEPVKFFDANSTRADLVPLRVVPSYTLEIEPKQVIEIPSSK